MSAPVPFLFLWTLDLGFGIWDLDLGLGFGTGLGLDNNDDDDDVSRVAGPLLVTEIYEQLGTYWMLGSVTSLMVNS